MYTGIISTNKAVNNAKNRLNQEDKQLTTIYQELLLCFTCNNTLLLDNALLFELNIGKEHLLKSFNILLKNDSLLDISDRKALYHILFTLIINICEQSSCHMLPMLIDRTYALVTSPEEEVSLHNSTHETAATSSSSSSSSDIKVNNIEMPNNNNTSNANATDTTTTATITQADNTVDNTPTTPVPVPAPVAVAETLNSSSIFSLVSRLTSSHSKTSKPTSSTTSSTTSTRSDKLTLLTCLDSLRELDTQVPPPHPIPADLNLTYH